MGWLPDYLPPTVRFIISTTPGPSAEALVKLNSEQLPLTPLSEQEREALIVRFLGEYRKHLSRPQLKRLSQDKKSSNALFLRTLLEELRLSGEYSLLDATIEHYLSAHDTDELFQFVLERMETDYGRDLVASVLSMIGASRRGLSEPEIAAITRADRVTLSQLLVALDFHLMKPSGRFTFFHDYLRRAVRRRYLANPLIDREAHRRLARYFATLEPSSRRIEEEPWQWQQAGEKKALEQCLAHLEIFEIFAAEELDYELLGYWLVLDRPPSACYIPQIEIMQASSGKTEHLETLAASLGELFYVAGEYDAAAKMYERALELNETALGSTPRQVQILLSLGKTLQALGATKRAEEILLTAIDASRRLPSQDAGRYFDILSALATVRYSSRDLEGAALILRSAIAERARSTTVQDNVTVSMLTNLGAVLYESQALDECEDVLEEALRVSTAYFGTSHPETAQVLNNLAAARLAKGESEQALDLFQHALTINERAFGRRHPYALGNLVNIGMVAYKSGDYSLACSTYRDALSQLGSMLPDTHATVIRVTIQLGKSLIMSGDIESGLPMVNRTKQTLEMSASPDPALLTQCCLAIAKAYVMLGESEQANTLFAEHIPQSQRIFGRAHPVTIEAESDQAKLAMGGLKHRK